MFGADRRAALRAFHRETLAPVSAGRIHGDRDAELAICFLRGSNHGLAFRDGQRHRLLAEHVLSGLERADRVFRMH